MIQHPLAPLLGASLARLRQGWSSARGWQLCAIMARHHLLLFQVQPATFFVRTVHCSSLSVLFFCFFFLIELFILLILEGREKQFRKCNSFCLFLVILPRRLLYCLGIVLPLYHACLGQEAGLSSCPSHPGCLRTNSPESSCPSEQSCW